MPKKSSHHKLIVILGPTASGKTELAIQLAQQYNGEIISADSRQVYQQMDIGTAKPSDVEQNKVPHHLIDVVRPDKEFSLADYLQLAHQKIEQLHEQNKPPFLVGGTGLYISAIVDNYQLPDGKVDPELRNKLKQQSLEKLAHQLQQVDPVSAQQIDLHNKRRVRRALEYYYTTQQSLVERQNSSASAYDILQVGIKIPRQELVQRINTRVDKMIQQGLVNEVKSLLEQYSPDLKAFDTIGYQEIIKHLQGEYSLNEAIQQIKIHTRQYAKRQMTWFRRDERIHWIKSPAEAKQIVKKLYTQDP